MARMTVRATYALDEQTSQRIKQLAKQWHVSQAEVIRRSVQSAAEHNAHKLTPADVIARYVHGSLLRSKEETRDTITAQRNWRHEEDAHRVPCGES